MENNIVLSNLHILIHKMCMNKINSHPKRFGLHFKYEPTISNKLKNIAVLAYNIMMLPTDKFSVPNWLNDEMQIHLMETHKNGHNLIPCCSKECKLCNGKNPLCICHKCEKISIEMRIHDLISHTARICTRSIKHILGHEIAKNLIDKHQDESFRFTVKFIEDNCRKNKNFVFDCGLKWFIISMAMPLALCDEETYQIFMKCFVNFFQN